MKNIFESLHFRSKPKTPKAVSADGPPGEDWEGTQVTLNGWKSLTSEDLRETQAEGEAPEQVFEGFGAIGEGENVDLSTVPTRTSEDTDFLLDDLDINSTPSSPGISYGGGQHEYLPEGVEESQRRFGGGAELQAELGEKNRALAELFGGTDDSTQDGLENLLSSFQQQSPEPDGQGEPPPPPYVEGAFFEGESAKQDDFLDQLLTESNSSNSHPPVPIPSFQVSDQVTLNPDPLGAFKSKNHGEFAKYQDSLPRISTLSDGLPPDHPTKSESSSPDDLCRKIASALAHKGVKPIGLGLLPPPSSTQTRTYPDPGGVARSAPTSPPGTPHFRSEPDASQLRRSKSVHSSPRELSPAPGGVSDGDFRPPLNTSPSPSSVLTSGQRSPKRKDNPVAQLSPSKRLNGVTEKGAVKPFGPNSGVPTIRINTGELIRNGLYYDGDGVPHWKGPAPKKGEVGYDDYLRYRQFLSAKARDKKAALQRIEKESHVRLQGTVENLDEQLEDLVLKLQRCLSRVDGEMPLREILSAAESMKEQVRQSLDWRQEQEAQLLDQIERGQSVGEEISEDVKPRDRELDLGS